MEFICPFTVQKKYVRRFNIMPIIFNIISSPCMNQRLSFYLNLRNLYPLWFHYLVIFCIKLGIAYLSIGISIRRSIFDFLKLFKLLSGSSLRFFSESNTWNLSTVKFVLTKCTAKMILLNFNSGKTWQTYSLKNTLDCLSKL